MFSCLLLLLKRDKLCSQLLIDSVIFSKAGILYSLLSNFIISSLSVGLSINTLGQEIKGISQELNRTTDNIGNISSIFFNIIYFIKYLSYFIFKSIIVK